FHRTVGGDDHRKIQSLTLCFTRHLPAAERRELCDSWWIALHATARVCLTWSGYLLCLWLRYWLAVGHRGTGRHTRETGVLARAQTAQGTGHHLYCDGADGHRLHELLRDQYLIHNS